MSAAPLLPGPDRLPVQSAWWGGFECSAHRRANGARVDVIDGSRHDVHAAADYAAVAAHGLRTVRDGLRWHRIEASPGRADWASWRAQLDAARTTGTQVVWDLLHYGLPDGLDLWTPAFVDRFAAFARAAALVHYDATDAVPWWCPINEMSFWSWAGGDAGFFPPFAHGRGFEMKVQLARAAVAAARAVRDVDPRARLLWAEPAIHVACDPKRPHDAPAAEDHRLAQYQAYDLVAGRLWPQAGGSPDLLDVVGVNYYPTNQWIHGGPPIGTDHALARPFADMLVEVDQRYGRPVVVAETGTEGPGRAAWLRHVAGHVRAARAAGAAVEAVCWYPIADHPGWDDDRHCPNGLLGYPDAAGTRPVDADLAAELARQQATPLPPLGARPDAPRTLPPRDPDAVRARTGPDAVRARAVPDLFDAPDARLTTTVVVPARDEAERLPALVAALNGQRDAAGRPLAPGSLDVLVLVNNTRDASMAVLRRLRAAHPALALRAAAVTLAGDDAHVGRARQLLLDAAWLRLDALGRGTDGVLLSTDADTLPAPTWVADNRAALAAGADAVGGRELLLPHERRALPPRVHRLYLLDLGYRRALEELRHLYAPDPHDPFPRHHHHFGASLGVTAGAYAAVGGLPAARTHEDIAFVQALVAHGLRVRHCERVRVYTSARDDGRATGGLADTLAAYARTAAQGAEPHVEPAHAAERRLVALGRARRAAPEVPPDAALAYTPPPRPGAAEPLPVALAALRRRIARLRPLPLEARLALTPLP